VLIEPPGGAPHRDEGIVRGSVRDRMRCPGHQGDWLELTSLAVLDSALSRRLALNLARIADDGLADLRGWAWVHGPTSFDGAERRCQSGIETIVRLLLRGLGVRHRHRWCHCIRASATHPPVGGAERRWDAPILMFHVKRQRCRVLTALRHALTLPRALGGAAWYLSRDVGAGAGLGAGLGGR
jgi:hypothetical protein